jgi:hypothetical protein
MSGAIPPLPNTPSRCGAQLKHSNTFTFTSTFLLHFKFKKEMKLLEGAYRLITLQTEFWTAGMKEYGEKNGRKLKPEESLKLYSMKKKECLNTYKNTGPDLEVVTAANNVNATLI